MSAPRILVVEDDAITADSLRQTLLQMHYDVLGPVATGEQAVAQGIADQPDVVLMDVRLRGQMDGVEAAARIRERAHIPVVYLTAYADEAQIRQAATTEPYAYLTKPVRDRDLAASIEVALYRSRTDRKLRHLNQVLRALRELTQLVTRERDPDRLLAGACSILVQTRGYHLAWIGTASEDGGIAARAWAGQGMDLVRRVAAEADACHRAELPCHRVVSSRQPQVCPDILAHPAYARWREEALASGFRVIAAAPMLYGEHLLGVLCVHADQADFFEEDETDLLLEVASDLALGLWSISQEAGRRRAQEALLRSEQDYRHLFEAAIEGIAVADPETGILLDCNQAFVDLVGWERAELIGQPQKMLHPPDEHVGAFSVSFDQHRRGEEGQSLESVVITKSGERRIVSIRARAHEIAGRKVLQGFFRDVTQRKLAEKEKEQQIGRIALLNEIARAVAEKVDVSSVLSVVTARLEEGLPVDQAYVALYEPETDALRLATCGPGGAEAAARLGMGEGSLLPPLTPFQRRCLDGETLCIADLRAEDDRMARRAAEAGIGSLACAPLIAGGKPFGILAAGRRQPNAFTQAEMEFLRVLGEHVSLALHHARLYEELENAYAELAQAQDAVVRQERLRALGQMASGIAHDFNNALMPIVAYTELLLTVPGVLEDREKATRFLKSIAASADSAAGTVARLRSFYRPRDADAAYGPVNIEEVIRETVALTQPRWKDQAQAAGAEVCVKVACTGALVVAGQASELREALTNLILNAVDALPQGGTITVGSHPDSAGNVVLEVMDTGVGMSEETKRRCMEPFFTTKGQRGTGLGLAMVYGTVQRHQGTMEVESAPGKGTTIRITFPAYEAPEAAPEAHSAAATVRPLRILLVDDEAFVRDAMAEFLRVSGHAVEVADNGLDALQCFRVGAFDVVITDRAMPQMGGDQLALAIRAMDPHQPIVMLTGFGDFMQAHGEQPAGVDEVIGKPVNLKQLTEALVRLVARNRPA